MKNISIKELRFVTEYLTDFNATQAAIRAGYSKRWANKIGPNLLNKPSIIIEISKIKTSILEDHKITIDKIIQELFKIAFWPEDEDVVTISDLIDLKKLPQTPKILSRMKSLSINKGRIKIDFVDRLKAAELLVTLIINTKQTTHKPLQIASLIKRYRSLYK